MFKTFVLAESDWTFKNILNMLCWIIKIYHVHLYSHLEWVVWFRVSFDFDETGNFNSFGNPINLQLLQLFLNTTLPNSKSMLIIDKEDPGDERFITIESNVNGVKYEDPIYKDDYVRWKVIGLTPLMNVLTCPMAIAECKGSGLHSVCSSYGTGHANHRGPKVNLRDNIVAAFKTGNNTIPFANRTDVVMLKCTSLPNRQYRDSPIHDTLMILKEYDYPELRDFHNDEKDIIDFAATADVGQPETENLMALSMTMLKEIVKLTQIDPGEHVEVNKLAVKYKCMIEKHKLSMKESDDKMNCHFAFVLFTASLQISKQIFVKMEKTKKTKHVQVRAFLRLVQFLSRCRLLSRSNDDSKTDFFKNIDDLMEDATSTEEGLNCKFPFLFHLMRMICLGSTPCHHFHVEGSNRANSVLNHLYKNDASKFHISIALGISLESNFLGFDGNHWSRLKTKVSDIARYESVCCLFDSCTVPNNF